MNCCPIAQDIRVVMSGSVEDMLKESLEVFQTKGEWVLMDIRGTQHILELEEGNYYEARFFVSKNNVAL